MLEKYNIEDLYLASVRVEYPKYRLVNGEMVKSNNNGGYNYSTIVFKDKDKYIDLSFKSVRFGEAGPLSDSFIIESLEPLSNIYSGKKKIDKKKVLKINKEHNKKVGK